MDTDGTPGLFCSHKLTLLSSERIKAILTLVKKKCF